MSTSRFTDSTLEACAYLGYILGGITLLAAGVFFARDRWFPSGELSPQPITLAELLSAPGEARWVSVSGFTVAEDYVASEPPGKTHLILLPTTTPNPDAPRALVATISAFTSEDALTREEIKAIVEKQALTGKFEGVAMAEGKIGNLLQVKYRGLGGQGVAVLKCNTPGTRTLITNPKVLGLAAAILLVGGLLCHGIDRWCLARVSTNPYQRSGPVHEPDPQLSWVAARVMALAFLGLGIALSIGLLHFIPTLMTREAAVTDLLADGARPELNVTVSGFRLADSFSLDKRSHYVFLRPRDDSPGTPARPLVVLFDYEPDPDDLAKYESNQSLRGEFLGRMPVNGEVSRRLRDKLALENVTEAACMKGPPNPQFLQTVWVAAGLGAVMLAIRLWMRKWVPLWDGNRDPGPPMY